MSNQNNLIKPDPLSFINNFKKGDIVYFRQGNHTSSGKIIAAYDGEKYREFDIEDHRSIRIVKGIFLVWQTADQYRTLRAEKKVKLQEED